MRVRSQQSLRITEEKEPASSSNSVSIRIRRVPDSQTAASASAAPVTAPPSATLQLSNRRDSRGNNGNGNGNGNLSSSTSASNLGASAAVNAQTGGAADSLETWSLRSNKSTLSFGGRSGVSVHPSALPSKAPSQHSLSRSGSKHASGRSTPTGQSAQQQAQQSVTLPPIAGASASPRSRGLPSSDSSASPGQQRGYHGFFQSSVLANSGASTLGATGSAGSSASKSAKPKPGQQVLIGAAPRAMVAARSSLVRE